ncbi:MAG TPA: metallopeptidase family protein [Myxococcaceae bacterium]|nr:metallopeptidase family protein [Myxococcaceae bacterium]
MHRRWTTIALLALAAACQSTTSKDKGAAAAKSAETAAKTSPATGGSGNAPLSTPATGAKKVVPLAVCQAEGSDPLGAARKFYDDGKYEDALSCAAQSTALLPDDPQAHSERGAALTALGRFDEAALAYARALALDPDHLDALLGAARLYAIHLPSSRERDELASVYAEHGLVEADKQGDKDMQVELALVAAMAFNDLGQAKDALERAERVLSLDKGNKDAAYERAIALFELCRFPEAKAAFSSMLDDKERAAHAHQHLGLLFEREGKYKLSEKHFAKARELSPEDFPAPVEMSPEAFKEAVARAVGDLPADMRKDLGGVPVTAEEIPKDEDLLSGEPPLSPAILGLFRGPPLGEKCSADESPCRSVALYRRNLERAVRNGDELREQIRVTLLHEVGHLRGEDDFELAARGLE